MTWIKKLWLSLLLGSVCHGAMAADERPNFLIIVADDLGYSDLGSYGGEIDTPNIDSLATQGMQLTNFHTAPVCSPTRAMLLSGADSHVAGLGNMGELLQPFQQGQPGYEGFLNDRMVTVAQVLKEAGYHTYTTGKWHLGRTEETSPKARGFERSFILVQGGASHFDDQHAIIAADPKAIYREDGKQVEVPKGFYSSEFYTDRLISYLEADKGSDKPFMAMLSYTAPHWPLHAPDEWLDKYKGRYDGGYEQIRAARLERQKALGIVSADTQANTPMAKGLPRWEQLSPQQREREARNMEIYAAMVSNMDFHIGRLLKYLEDQGKLDNTFIVFISDNGADGNSPVDLPGNKAWLARDFDNSLKNLGHKGSYADYGAQWAQVSSTPYPLFKGFVTEGGIRAPAIISARMLKEAHLQGTRRDDVVHVVDLMPTLLDLAAVPPLGKTFQGRPVQTIAGKSMLPLLEGQAMGERQIGWELFGRKALRKGDWKISWVNQPYGDSAWRLFNLKDDPTESRNLAHREPAKLQEMQVAWEQYVKENNVLEGEFELKYGFQTCLYEYCFK